MMTKRGVELNLYESNFKYSLEGLCFYFSSQFYLNNFVERSENFSKTESLKFKTKYTLNVDMKLLFLIALYKKIEKRGFRIVDELTNKELSENAGFSVKLIMY